MSDKPDIAIIGPGVVGTTLGILARQAGYPLAGVGGRRLERARAAAERMGADVRAGSPEEIARAGSLVLLTVSDDAIEPVCRQLAEAGAFASGSIVAHCSGAMSSEVLCPARDLCGADIGSMHPLQTFPSVEAALERFPGTYCFCEGDAPAVAALGALAKSIGGNPVHLSAGGKMLYHAAAVIACNYLTALLDGALTAAAHAGISRADAAAALEPLIRSTLENVLSLGPAAALTGPIARGDEGLLERQYRSVCSADGPLGELYRVLGLRAVELALEKGSIDREKAGRLRRILSGQ